MDCAKKCLAEWLNGDDKCNAFIFQDGVCTIGRIDGDHTSGSHAFWYDMVLPSFFGYPGSSIPTPGDLVTEWLNDWIWRPWAVVLHGDIFRPWPWRWPFKMELGHVMPWKFCFLPSSVFLRDRWADKGCCSDAWVWRRPRQFCSCSSLKCINGIKYLHTGFLFH